MLVGSNKLVDPGKLSHVYVSPRRRAQETYELLFDANIRAALQEAGKVEITQTLAEWNYGDYEGLKEHEIRALRNERGLDKERPWDIWSDGCENGE